MTTTLEVYEADHSTLVDTIDAGQWARVRCADVMNLAGGGEIELPNIVASNAANPALDLLTPGRIVRVVSDGVDVGAFVLEQPVTVPLSPQEESGESTTITGREPVTVLLDKTRWYPDRGLGVLPYHPDRQLAVGADRLRDDDPDGPQGAWPFGYPQTPDQDVSNWFGRGIGFIDTAGPGGAGPHFIADRDSREAGAPGGRQFYRQRDDIDDDWDAVLVQAVFDDQGVLFVNNYPTLRSEGVYKGQCVQAIIPLTAGDCLVAGWVDNLNELRVGVAFAIWSIVDGMADECLMRSDASKCRVLAYPSKPPGFTPTEVIRLGVDEANDRGMLPDVDTFCDFISASDSDSQPMSEVTDLTVKAPADSLLTTCQMLAATYLDLRAKKDALELQAYVRGTMGQDRTATVLFEKGNCGEIRHGSDFAEQATVALVTVEGEAPFEVVHPDEADLGRIEIALDFGATSVASGRVWARRYLDEVSYARRSIAVTLVPGVGPVPQDDFQVGDWITIGPGGPTTWGGTPITWGDDDADWGGPDGDPHRVHSIGLEVGEDSLERWTVELDQPSALLEERLAAIMRRQLPGAAGGRTILPTPSEPQFASNSQGSESTETWSADALGDVVLTKNGTPITGATLTGPGGVTLTDDERKCATGDLISFTVDGTDGFPAGWPVPAPGCWIQHFSVEQDTGTTVRIDYTTGVQ